MARTRPNMLFAFHTNLRRAFVEHVQWSRD